MIDSFYGFGNGLIAAPWWSAADVLVAARGAADAQQPLVQGNLLSNKTNAAAWIGDANAKPATASIYQLDGLVRRAESLQLTADGQAALTPAQRQVHAAREPEVLA